MHVFVPGYLVYDAADHHSTLHSRKRTIFKATERVNPLLGRHNSSEHVWTLSILILWPPEAWHSDNVYMVGLPTSCHAKDSVARFSHFGQFHECQHSKSESTPQNARLIKPRNRKLDEGCNDMTSFGHKLKSRQLSNMFVVALADKWRTIWVIIW